MALKLTQLQAKLAEKRSAFSQFDVKTYRDFGRYKVSWERFCQAPPADWPPKAIGAKLLEPLTETESGVIPANLQWASREESLVWVRQRLTGVTTFAVDGSQIFPSKDLSVPVALVQVGWYENRHDGQGGYTKDVELDVLTPADLKAGNSAEPVDRRVNMRRFEMEVDRLVRYIEAVSEPERCLVFLDGSLVATFAEAFDPDTRDVYRLALMKLLAVSQARQVPLVGYIDTSYARDLTTTLAHLYRLGDAPSVHDAQMVHHQMQWGDRTPLFECDRSGILLDYGDQRHQITFTYLKTTRDGYPARLEIPRWVWDAGRLNQILDWVRGEVIIGGGYPYVIETADQTAVLQAQDRQLFYRILQDWADRSQIQIRLSRKMVSKARRR
jgi:hypothetical protein